MGVIDLINNPVAVVFDHRDTRGPGYTPVKTLNPVVNCEGDGSYGDCSALPGYGRVENPAEADSWLVLSEESKDPRAYDKQRDNITTLTEAFAEDSLWQSFLMPKRSNLCENCHC